MSVRLFLVTYDLNQEGHSWLRYWLKQEYGELELGSWIRVQKSVIIVRDSGTPHEWDARVHLGAPQRMGQFFIVDITTSTYSGRGEAAVWDWLAARRADISADTSALNSELESMKQEMAGAPEAAKHEYSQALIAAFGADDKARFRLVRAYRSGGGSDGTSGWASKGGPATLTGLDYLRRHGFTRVTIEMRGNAVGVQDFDIAQLLQL